MKFMKLYPPDASDVHLRDWQLARKALVFIQESEERQVRTVLIAELFSHIYKFIVTWLIFLLFCNKFKIILFEFIIY